MCESLRIEKWSLVHLALLKFFFLIQQTLRHMESKKKSISPRTTWDLFNVFLWQNWFMKRLASFRIQKKKLDFILQFWFVSMR